VILGAAARTPGLGIGNNPGIGASDPDWTFTANGRFDGLRACQHSR